MPNPRDHRALQASHLLTVGLREWRGRSIVGSGGRRVGDEDGSDGVSCGDPCGNSGHAQGGRQDATLPDLGGRQVGLTIRGRHGAKE